MGYYSFYKIIKDIIHTIFGRKFFRLLLIILITIPIVSYICSPVFATYDVSYGDNTIILPDLPSCDFNFYVIARSSDNGNIEVAYFDEDVYFELYGVGAYLNTSSGNVIPFHMFSISVGDNSIYDYSSYSWVDNGVFNRSAIGGTIYKNIISSNFDIYDIDGNIVFSPPITNSNPYFSNASDVVDYDFNNLYINMGDFTVDDVAYLHKLEVDRTFENDTGVVYYKQSVFKLYSDSDYYGITDDLVSYYSIPRSVLNLSSNKEYLFVLNDNSSSINATNGLYSDSSAFDTLHLKPENSVITPDKEQNDAITGNTDAINKLENTISSTDYDENQIQIDSSLSNDVDEKTYTNFITDIINSINNAITCDWNTVETVEIPLGFVDESITWKSDLLSAHIPQPLKVIINTFWMFLFGFYIFKFSLSLVNWLKSGEILDGKGFNSDEVITSNML